MSTVIRVEHVSKQYRLGLVGSGTMRDDLESWWHRVRGKEDPTLKLGEANDRSTVGNSDYVWALRDINFEVQQGEVLGIIGKNGAGKSTLLKLLSRVTAPTIGNIKVKGRIASLLEVGTGFHPELTGRENIFLNGAIMGMKKHEIARKLDEIVDFAGVERYLETPVKRYSSGMYVRLAFAVAAHLEPEILIVDEVLAVGDAEFQKKALGKMKDVSSGSGRTVLFVSHNMAAVQQLCKSGILLADGQVNHIGTADEVVERYLRIKDAEIQQCIAFETPDAAPGNENARVMRAEASPQHITVEDEIHLTFTLHNGSNEHRIRVIYDLVNMHEQIVFGSGTLVEVASGRAVTTVCTIPGKFLNDSIYSINLYLATEDMRPLYEHLHIISFEVTDVKRGFAYTGKINGVVRPELKWVTVD
ncbi:MAG: ATP-binding cassette domain-containing protein [Flavobacteriales bacterium]|nr:ATP-binding cassette domain-containing protein [Flavobacteriales bacterium]